jgi:hypothetical protein
MFGKVNQAGQIVTGTGFTVARIGVGLYTLTFTPAFDTMPVIVVSPSTPGDYNATTSGLTATGCQVQIFDQTGTPAGSSWHFSAQAATPARETASFGGLIAVPLSGSATLLTLRGLTFKATCTASTEDPTKNVGTITVSTDQDGTWYSSMNLVGGAALEINIADGDVAVLSYDAGCDEPGGPFMVGGISFTLAKPSGFAVNGVLGCGVGVLGADAVFSGMMLYSGPFVAAPEGVDPD